MTIGGCQVYWTEDRSKGVTSRVLNSIQDREANVLMIAGIDESTLNNTRAICILGRGIEKVWSSKGLLWKPTRYVESPTNTGAHSGYRRHAEMDDASSFIAGANANIIAAQQLFEGLLKAGAPPPLMVFAAGRAAYLTSDPDPTLTEGKILAEEFNRRIRLHGRQTQMIVLERNRDTQDDIQECIRVGRERSIENITVITVDVHVPRAMEFARQFSGSTGRTCLSFIPAEAILATRYRSRPGVIKIINKLIHTRAYHRTAEREKRGVQALWSGTYLRAGQ